MIRAFLALPMPEGITHRLTLAQHPLPLPRPVEAGMLHLTLVFLDSQPESVLEDLHLILDGLRLPAPVLRLAGLGAFGGAAPDSVHALIAPDARLTTLQAKVARAARDVGIALPARRFVPHVTLGRGVCEPAELARGMAAAGAVTSEPWTATEMILYRSTLLKSGSAYDPLAVYALTP